MKILIVNDDGIDSLGLKILAEELGKLGEIYILAPEHHQSGKGQALTIRKKIKVKDYGNLYGAVKALSARGTPADCTRLAMFIYKDIEFDFVASGINQGANLGVDVLHSGTVGAAFEALSFGQKAIAISSAYNDFSMSQKYVKDLVKYLYESDLISNDYVLNVNFPSDKFSEPIGIKFTTQGHHKHKPIFKKYGSNKYYPIYENMGFIESEDSDVFAYKNGIISITPVFEDRSKLSVSQKFNKENKDKLNEVINYDKINIAGDN